MVRHKQDRLSRPFRFVKLREQPVHCLIRERAPAAAGKRVVIHGEDAERPHMQHIAER